MSENALLDMNGLPPFSQITPRLIADAVDHVLSENRARIQQLLDDDTEPSWDSLIQPLLDLDERLDRIWSPAAQMNAVVNSDELREVYNAALPKLSAYHTEIGQNERLYSAYKRIRQSDDYLALSEARQKIIDNAVRDFELSGVALAADDKRRFKDISERLSTLSSQFSDNVLDATQHWFCHVTNETELAGLPESAVSAARQEAEQRGLGGWVFTLDFPSYFAVITYADHRPLRQRMYEAFVTRASDQGPDAGQWDNSAIMAEILSLRQELASLLGYTNYAEYSLVTKMASDPDAVIQFIEDLAVRTRPMAQQEVEELRAFAANHDSAPLSVLEAWDVAWYSEKLRIERYDISQEILRPWFPVNRVLSGMFDIVQRLYGIEIQARQGVDCWHDDVQFFDICDADSRLIGQFYLDLYARAKKRGGAWMAECIGRKRTADGVQTPVAYLTCNFNPPLPEQPALLTHNEVITLFHEFGHGLHHLLTQVDDVAVAGIHGVAWDAVELPSQFMENWCWRAEAIPLISGHYDSGKPLPESLLTQLLAAKNFQSGMQMLRQLEFALFDFRIHCALDDIAENPVQQALDQVRSQIAVLMPPPFNRFQHSFTHIFAGGYAAGYYSYKWAEVLASDAFSKFEDNGVFDAATGRRFKTAILERGGASEPMTLFVDFMGREPSIDALLRHSGLA